MMKSLPSLILFCGIFAMVIFSSSGEEKGEVDKRYVAALAKNGRLPKFGGVQKKDHSQEDKDEDYSKDEAKRHIGAFLKLHGKPNSMRVSNSDDSDRDEKRNIASMARLGRLNSVRLARFQPFAPEGKRMSSEEVGHNDEDNALSLFQDPDCVETEDEPEDTRPIWMQKKRYVAALARSGRLPIWHSQRMWWGGKRDDSRQYWASDDNGNAENTLEDVSFVGSKIKKCKNGYDYQMGKRNVASLARNGKLPFRA